MHYSKEIPKNHNQLTNSSPVKSMENLTNNPNLSVDIGQNILQCLDVASLQTFRFVDKSMKRMVDKPRFWLQKLEKKGLNPCFKSKTLKIVRGSLEEGC